MLSSLIRRPGDDRPLVCCPVCDHHPVLPSRDEALDFRKCVRCQGENRWLALPHPDDHLCAVCRRECPDCRATTDHEGRLCRSCRGDCRTCGEPMTDRDLEGLPDEVLRVPAESRRDQLRRFDKIYFPIPAGRTRCARCRTALDSTDPVRQVLAALPQKVVLACGGNLPPTTIAAIRRELTTRTPLQLIQRIERRWWGGWADRPLRHRPADDYDEDAYGPDDVALWLLAATACTNRCEDGWLYATHPAAQDTPCPACRAGRDLPHRRRRREEAGDDTDGAPAARSLQAAVDWRPPIAECPGRDGACGSPVADGYTQCPECLDWPPCPACARRRVPPTHSGPCRACERLAAEMTPPPPREPRPDTDEDFVPEDTSPAARTVTQAVHWRPPQYECPGMDGICGRPVTTENALCDTCLTTGDDA
ncbi:hypothetical protein [Streptomyces smaragdinus]|uniref:hypothetical protein n=1 Tax=Streptomyces smaragdinus TaxID=2585196 RepID=UPI001294902B|nr:hypothetical protein [Streptomyces smaragdinus]